MLQDPNTSKYRINLIKRIIAKREWLEGWELDLLFGYLPEEDETIEERNMLSAEIDVEFSDMNVDRNMKYEIYKTAIPTPAKERALIAVSIAISEQKQIEQTMNQSWGMMMPTDPTIQASQPTFNNNSSPISQYIENQGKQYQMVRS